MDSRKRDKVVKWWVDRILSGYPIKPVIEVVEYVENSASKITDAILELYSGKSFEETRVEEPIDDLMRFLATDRNLSPGDSIKLLMELRDVIADELSLEGEERLKFNLGVEKLILKAFDAYMACREKIFELRLREKERDIEIMRKIIEFSNKC